MIQFQSDRELQRASEAILRHARAQRYAQKHPETVPGQLSQNVAGQELVPGQLCGRCKEILRQRAAARKRIQRLKQKSVQPAA